MGAAWNTTFPTTPTKSFESLYTPQLNKRPLQLEVNDFPHAKRHEAFSPFTTPSITGSSNWALETQPTPAASSDGTGLSDEAADVCLCVSEGVERVKPCFRKYHFSQHFRNIHPGLNSGDYEESSVVHSDTSLPQAAGKCGFCIHRFVSRQDRIDHIAEHFKNGKCMLDWNEDDSNESDDMDDDDDNDDRPDSGGFGNGKPSFPPQNDPRGSGSGHRNNGNGGNGSQPPQSGFYQFQVSQFADSDSRGVSPGVEQLIQKDSTGEQHNKRTLELDNATCNTNTIESDKYIDSCSLHSRHDETTRDDSQTVAGDDVALLSADVLQLQTIPPRVPPSDGDPAPDRLKALTPMTNGMCIALSGKSHKSNYRAGLLTRETQDLLGSLKLLGAGGFSTVDEVVHRETSLRFARKTLKNREHSAIEELKNEVDVLKKLRHPHIIRFVDSIQKGDRMSILLSPVAETTLAAWLDTKLQNKPEGLSETIVTMMGCLASSIRYLHEQRPVVKHMDIKPQNILVKQGEGVPHVFLSDFGVSSIGDITANSKTMPLTRQYCAPEVSEGVSRELASDIWSLGCVFLEMLTVAYKDDNPRWLDLRHVFGGRKGKYYWQDVPALQGLLTQSLEQAPTRTEANATSTVKEMLSYEPAERPTAPRLTMVFTPAPCCLSWPNEKVAYPGPSEELQTVKTFFQEDGRDGSAHLHDVADQQQQQSDTMIHAKRWIEECSHDHEACRYNHHEIVVSKTLPTRLIDILPDGDAGVSVRVVNGADLDENKCPDYIALSYVWADDELKLSTARLEAMQTELRRDTLPKAINEAIAKAQDIGFRYLWVDNLCVLQDSDEDKERESRAMADVYRNAALTIVATQKGIDQQALQAAVLPLSTYLTPGFAWDTRAWSLQERLLSRRFLHLGEEQMYWECNALKASETFPRGLESFRHALSSLLWEKVHTRSDLLSAVSNTSGHDHDRMHRNRKFDVEGSGPTNGFAGNVTKCNANGQGAPCANKAKGYGKMATPHQAACDFSPNLQRDCQYIRKEGDGIGDSMEAAQTQLQLASATQTSSSAGLTRSCLVDDHASSEECPNGVKDRGNGIGDEGLYGKNRGVRWKNDDDGDVMG
ncbi:hypothetical protein SLS60_000877 [Paraconiothyrium brasiliense]|uniref:Protein kinase domain-containing protein n=1 Tax=Paraconiothyrium brasiliense TaxID=300254 RepID=A0ABR3S817_9PLEO